MFQENLSKALRSKFVALVFFVILFSATRFLYLGPDEINPDGVNWHYRSQQFVVGLKLRQFERTYQHYHPGVTLMWISGVPIELYKQITGINTYNHNNFLAFNLVAKVSVILVQFMLTLIVLYLLSKNVGFKIAYPATLLFSLEPFFLGNSRLYHMDVLFTLFTLISLLLSWQALKKFSWGGGFLSGVSLSLSFLTKSVGIGALVFVVAFAVAYFLNRGDRRVLAKYLVAVVSSFIVTTFLLFPALWVRPVYYLSEIFSESERVGVRKGHPQILFGEYTEDAGLLFYPLVILMKVTPFVIAGVIAYAVSFIVSVKKKGISLGEKYSSLFLYLLIFYLGYLAVMSFPSKKIDRYMLPLYPFLSFMAVYGLRGVYKELRRVTHKRFFIGVVILFATVSYALPLISYFPYYFTYTSPVFGSPASANSVVAQKPFGVAIPALKQHIIDRYGGEPRLGFIDTKPMKAIYPNSKVFDIRVNGVSDYDLLILGVNETMPDKVLRSCVRFRKDSSLFINGLEYWRIYAKEN